MLNAPVIVNAPIHILVKIGQGEGDTKWNGWPTDLYIVLVCKLIIFIVIFLIILIVFGVYLFYCN